MSLPTYGAGPGIGARESSITEKAVVWGGVDFIRDVNNLLIDSTAVDAANSPVTELRAGLLLGKKTSDSMLYEWDAEAVDGTELVYGVLYRGISMLNASGVVEDKTGHVLLHDMGLIVADLLIKGTAFTSHADEHLARRQLAARGFRLDDDIHGGGRSLGTPIANLNITAATLTPTTAQNGYRFLLSNAASTTVTLPTLEPGLVYDFLRIGDEEMIIASAAGGDVIAGNDLAANSITFTTAGEHIGANVRVESIRYGTTLKWLVTIGVVPFGTANTGLTFGIAT